MKTLVLGTALALSFGGAALAQTTTPATPRVATSPAAPTPDPIRLAAAKPVVDAVFAPGTYRRMMEGTLSKMVDQLMGSVMDMKASDMLETAAPDAKSKAKMKSMAGDQSLGQMAESADPAFRERTRISMDVMFKEMIPMMEKIEPQVRASLTNIYARKFTATQLEDMGRFFATPSGRAYADQSMLVFMDPEIMQSMQSFVPELLKAMPGIMKKVEVATAHLPKPKGRDKDSAMQAAEDALAEAQRTAGASDPDDLTTGYENWSQPDQAKVDGIIEQLSALNRQLNEAQEAAIANAKARMTKK